MTLQEKIIHERKEKLGLDKIDTEKVFNDIMNCYRNKLLDEPRHLMGYAIDIVIANMNKYNRLGTMEALYKKWGDNYYVDLDNSAFMELKITEDGDIETGAEMLFKELEEMNEIEKISFSLKKFIQLCKENNLKIDLIAKEDEEHMTTLEITPCEVFEERDRVNAYLNSFDKK